MSTTDEEGRVHIGDDDARGASSPGIVRYVLAISLLLAIVALSLVWMWPYLTGVTRS
jgi:hypothetical protein